MEIDRLLQLASTLGAADAYRSHVGKLDPTPIPGQNPDVGPNPKPGTEADVGELYRVLAQWSGAGGERAVLSSAHRPLNASASHELSAARTATTARRARIAYVSPQQWWAYVCAALCLVGLWLECMSSSQTIAAPRAANGARAAEHTQVWRTALPCRKGIPGWPCSLGRAWRAVARQMRRPLLEPSDGHGAIWSLVLDDAAAPQPERLRLARLLSAARRGDDGDDERVRGSQSAAEPPWPMDGTQGVARAISVLYGPDSPVHTERA